MSNLNRPVPGLKPHQQRRKIENLSCSMPTTDAISPGYRAMIGP